MCFEIICCESANGSVNPCTEAGPWESRSIIARRVGSDKAANVVFKLSTTIWLWIVGQLSSVDFFLYARLSGLIVRAVEIHLHPSCKLYFTSSKSPGFHEPSKAGVPGP